jgi:hypothetical protein
VEGASQIEWPNFKWKPGDAWGYRRHAYRKMADIVGGKGKEHWADVYSREPEHTKHLYQEATPPLVGIIPKVAA